MSKQRSASERGKRRVRRLQAVERKDLRADGTPAAVWRPSAGATSAMVKDVDPATRALIDAALAERGLK